MQSTTNSAARRGRLTPSRVRFWKYRMPSSMKTAFDESLDFAREAHNRSVDTIAELMGEEGKWSLYKWIGENRMPAHKIRPFEHACGIDLVSRWFAASTGKLLIPVAVGRSGSAEDISALQTDIAEAMRSLLSFYAGRESAEAAQAALLTAMQDMGWHHANVGKHAQPELEFDTNDTEN